VTERRHVTRDALMANLPDFQPILVHYRELRHRSEDARYRCIRFADIDVDDSFQRHYRSVRGHVMGLLGL
jgi:hypothetical protein